LDCPQPHSVAKLGRGQKQADQPRAAGQSSTPLRGCAGYILFKQVVELMNRGEHLTTSGLLKIINLKASRAPLLEGHVSYPNLCRGSHMKLNWGLSPKLREEWKNVTPVIRPSVLPTIIKDKQWLIGFVDPPEGRQQSSGEGSFQIITQKRQDKIWVSLMFTISQHIRDKVLMENMVKYLGCGRYYPTGTRKEGAFIVSNKKEILNIIIPLFHKYPWSKQEDL
jgi:hypothetical protein